VAGDRLPAGATLMLPIPVLEREPRVRARSPTSSIRRGVIGPPDSALLPLVEARAGASASISRTRSWPALAHAIVQRRHRRPLLGEPENDGAPLHRPGLEAQRAPVLAHPVAIAS
jgi:hypothetical protein